MSAPSRQDAMRLLLRGVGDDLAAYGALHALLNEQFEAALRHRGAALAELAPRIGALCDTLEARRAQRVQLVARLLGPQAGMEQVLSLLKGETRATLTANWQALGQLVLEAKRLSQRNGSLLVEQFSVMQRVIHGEEHTYAPV